MHWAKTANMVVQHHRVLYVVVGLVLGGPCRLGVVCDLPGGTGMI